MTPYFYISVFVLAALLFLPTSKMIWVLSVRRLEKKLGRTMSDQERNGQKARAQFISLLLVLIFSWLFNQHLLGTGNG